MTHLIPSSDSDEKIRSLEKEIYILEEELVGIENIINDFESKIRNALYDQLIRIRELTDLYKQQKKGKKAQRLEQKKRGKNYKEPDPAIKALSTNTHQPKVEEAELKRLYKEAIQLVHPDKFASEDEGKVHRATRLTTELIQLYKNGDLKSLTRFHEHIVSGNAMSHIPDQLNTVVNPKAMIQFLQEKKEGLKKELEVLKAGYSYQMIDEKKNVQLVIEELRQQFDQRIFQLKKRTRTK